MQSLKTTSIACAALAVLLLIAVQFLPWARYQDSGSSPGGSFGGFDFGGFQFDIKMDALLWEVRMEANGQEDSTSWYDNDADDTDGVALIRTAIPLVVVGGVLVLVAAVLAMAARGPSGILSLVGGVLLLAGVIVYSIGVDQFYDEATHDWQVAFYLAIAAILASLTAAVTGLMAGSSSRSAWA